MRVKARWMNDVESLRSYGRRPLKWSHWQSGTIIDGSFESSEITVAWDHDPNHYWNYELLGDYWEEINETGRAIEICLI